MVDGAICYVRVDNGEKDHVLRQTRQWWMGPYVTSESTMVDGAICYVRVDNGG